MADQVSEIIEHGAVGFVWEIQKGGALPDLESDCFRGDLTLTADQDVRVRLLEEDIEQPLIVQRDPVPAALLAMTPNGLVALHGISHRSASLGLMAPRASTRTYRCRTAAALPGVAGVAAELQPRQISAVFAGQRVADWAGQLALDEKLTTTNGRVTAVDIRLDSPPSKKVDLRAGLELESSAFWDVQAKGVGQVIAIGWEATVSGTKRAQEPDSLLMPLWRTQELLSIAFDGVVPASTGRVRYVEGEELAEVWDAMLMRHQPQVAPSERSSPSFTLVDLGGLDAVKRWVKLCTDYPRAVKPVIAKVRYNVTSAETRLLEVVAAIHYWVNAHDAKWADTTKKTGRIHEAALASQVGVAFEELVGDIDIWAGELRDYNNGLKHLPSFQADPERLHLLVWSADLLLEAALLHRVGRGKLAGNRHLREPRRMRAASRLRTELGTEGSVT